MILKTTCEHLYAATISYSDIQQLFAVVNWRWRQMSNSLLICEMSPQMEAPSINPSEPTNHPSAHKKPVLSMMFLSRQYTAQTYQAQTSLGSALEATKKKVRMCHFQPFPSKTPQKHPESPSTTITNLNFAVVYLTST